MKDLWVCSFIGMFSMGEGGGGKGGERGNILVAISLRAVQGISHRKEFCLKLSPLKP